MKKAIESAIQKYIQMLRSDCGNGGIAKIGGGRGLQQERRLEDEFCED